MQFESVKYIVNLLDCNAIDPSRKMLLLLKSLIDFFT